MTKKPARKAFSKSLENTILYKSARTCCVCRAPRMPVQIHHIDGDRSNNVEDNLVAICQNCHDEAHTTHTMSKNLSPDRLKDMKRRWEKDVAKMSAEAMTSRANLSQASWSYINYQKLIETMKTFGASFEPKMFNFLSSHNLIDHIGFPIPEKKLKTKTHLTIYDGFEWGNDQRLHHLYSEGVDDLIAQSTPIELGAIWSKTEIQNIVSPGDICFLMRGLRFRSLKPENFSEERYVYAQAGGVKVEFYANTKFMFGNSSIYCHFTGNKFTAALIIVRSIKKDSEGTLVITASPIAMGVGFVHSEYHTPYTLKYGWAKHVNALSNRQDNNELEQYLSTF